MTATRLYDAHLVVRNSRDTGHWPDDFTVARGASRPAMRPQSKPATFPKEAPDHTTDTVSRFQSASG